MRNWRDIERVKQEADLEETRFGVKNFPPSYITGFEFTLSPDYRVTISGGVTTVEGQAVYMRDTDIQDSMFQGDRTGGDGGFFWYVYLTRDGEYIIDRVVPVYSDVYYYYSNPFDRYRCVGKLWVGTDDKIKFCTNKIVGLSDTVRIAAYDDDEITEGDYKCTGEDDQIFIMAAAEFLYTEYGGGEIQLSRGEFIIEDDISIPYSNINITGTGAGTVLFCDGTLVPLTFGESGAPVSNCSIGQIKISGDTLSTRVIKIYGNLCTVHDIFNSSPRELCYIYGNNNEVLNNRIYIKPGLYKTDIIIRIAGNGNTVSQNNFTMEEEARVSYTIYFIGSYNAIINNVIAFGDAQYTGSGGEIYGASGSGDGTIISGNKISGGRIELDYVTVSMIRLAGENTSVIGNTLQDNGTMINDGHCQLSTPTMINESTNSTSNLSDDTQNTDITGYRNRTYSIKITKTIAAGTNGYFLFTDNSSAGDMHGLYAGLRYKFKVQVYIPSTGGPESGEVYIRFYASGGTTTQDLDDYATTNDAWEELSIEATINKDHTRFFCGIYFESTAAQNEYIYIGDVQLVPIGINNEHEQQFTDDGTNTNIIGNSWQSGVAGDYI